MKRAIVTGASRGLGRAFTEQLLAQGYCVDAISRSGDAPNAPDCRSVQADLSQPGAAAALAQTLFSEIQAGCLEEVLLINNAGTITPTCRIECADGSVLEQSYLLNLATPTILTAAFLKLFQNVKMPKRIVNISSGAAIKNYEGWGHYCAAKAGLDRLTQVAAAEQATKPFPTHIYSFYPGVLDTQMQAQIRATTKEDFPSLERFLNLHAHHGLVSPEAAAAKILSFCQQYPSSGIYDIREL